MEPLNVCIDKNKETLNQFLEGLTAVETLEQHLNVRSFSLPLFAGRLLSLFLRWLLTYLYALRLQLDKYLALERTNENMINISFNEMYFIHEMLLLHKNSLVLGLGPLSFSFSSASAISSV
jgi:hypothetical protein